MKLVEFLLSLLVAMDRFVPPHMLFSGLFFFRDLGAKGRHRARFVTIAERLGLNDEGQGSYEGYTLRARGDSPSIELRRPKKQRSGRYELDRSRGSDARPDGMVAFDSGRPLFDRYFGRRFADPELAERIRRGGPAVDTIARFIRRWGLKINTCRVDGREMSLHFYRGSGRSVHAWMPTDDFEAILPDMVAVMRAMDALMADDGPDSGVVAKTTGEPHPDDIDALVQTQLPAARTSAVAAFCAVAFAGAWGIVTAFAPIGPEALVYGTVAVLVLLATVLAHARAKTSRPIETRIAGRRPTAAATWGQFVLALTPFMGLILALEEVSRLRRGELQLSEHDARPVKLGPELRPRLRLYLALALIWPLAIAIAVLHAVVGGG